MRLATKTRVALLLAGMLGAMPCSARAQKPWPLWKAYVSGFDAQGRIIDHTAGGRTTSEGQAYAMFFALVANDRECFDKLLAWTQNNLAHGNLAQSLPGWLWDRDPTGKWRLVDRNSASDADLWICYTLLQAGRLWHEQRFTNLGAALSRLIQQREVAELPQFGRVLLPGERGFQHSGEYVLNPSYIPPQLLRALATELSEPDWHDLADTAVLFLEKSASAGYAMDWVSFRDGKFYATAGPGVVAGGSYDAIRVYLWIGMLATDAAERNVLLHSYPAVAAYIQKHECPPERVSPEGDVLRPRGGIGFSAAVLPYLDALSDSGAMDRQRARLAAHFNPKTGLYGDPPSYYDQNLALFATGWEERRFRFDRNGQLQVAWGKP